MPVSSVTTPDAVRVPGFYGWKLVAALWWLDLLNMGLPLYCSSVINAYMLQRIPMERSTFGLGYTLVNFFVGVPSALIALVILRRGVRMTLVLGATLIGAGALWMAQIASTPGQYLAGFGVIIGSGVGFGTVMPISTAITRWFTRYRGRALAIALTAWGVAGFLGAPLLNRFLEHNGGDFRAAWRIVAAASAVSALVAWFFVVERPEDLGQTPDGDAPEPQRNALIVGGAGRPRTVAWAPRDAYRTTAYWLILVGAVACQFPSFFFTAHGILHLRLSGLGAADAAWAMGLYTLGGLGGRILGGVLVDRIAERYAFMAGLSFYMIGTVLALRIQAPAGQGSPVLWIADAAALCYGAGMGSAFICLNTITGNYYGSAAFPRLNGTMMMLSGLLCAPAGVIAGKLFDASRSYTPAFLLNLVLCAAGLAALFFARRPDALARDAGTQEMLAG